LSVNGLFLSNRHNFPALTDSGKELRRVEIAFLRVAITGVMVPSLSLRESRTIAGTPSYL
jgi:hypothetical protein